jgi:hypothetical protein
MKLIIVVTSEACNLIKFIIFVHWFDHTHKNHLIPGMIWIWQTLLFCSQLIISHFLKFVTEQLLRMAWPHTLLITITAFFKWFCAGYLQISWTRFWILLHSCLHGNVSADIFLTWQFSINLIFADYMCKAIMHSPSTTGTFTLPLPSEYFQHLGKVWFWLIHFLSMYRISAASFRTTFILQRNIFQVVTISVHSKRIFHSSFSILY